MNGAGEITGRIWIVCAVGNHGTRIDSVEVHSDGRIGEPSMGEYVDASNVSYYVSICDKHGMVLRESADVRLALEQGQKAIEFSRRLLDERGRIARTTRLTR